MLMCDSLLAWATSTEASNFADCSAETEARPLLVAEIASATAVSRKLCMTPLLHESSGDGLTASSPATTTTEPLKARSLSGQSWQMAPLHAALASTANVNEVATAQGTKRCASPGPLLQRTSSSLASMPVKARCLAQAAARIVQHIVAVGACDDPRCLMFFDPEVFSRPSATSSRLRVESFRRKTASASAPSAGGQHQQADAHTCVLPPHEDLESLPSDDGHTFDEDFDLRRISKKLLSSAAQQSIPLRDFMADCLHALSAPSSPIRCSAETFVFALVLFERVQHAHLLSKTSAASPVRSPQQCGLAGLPKPALLATTLGAANGQPHQHPTATTVSIVPIPPHPVTPLLSSSSQQQHPDDRVRFFIDETTTAQKLTVENLQRLQQNNGTGSMPTTSGATMTTTFVSTNATVPFGSAAMSPFVARSRTPTARTTTSDSEPAMPQLCQTCSDVDSSVEGGLAIHPSNVHIFFAAAVLVAIKVREDFAARNPKVLALVASALHCSSVRSLFLAERCLCDALHFDIDVTVSDYRTMLRQLAAQRTEAATALSADGILLSEQQQSTPTTIATPPVGSNNSSSSVMGGPGGSSTTTSPSSNTSANYMTLFVMV